MLILKTREDLALALMRIPSEHIELPDNLRLIEDSEFCANATKETPRGCAVTLTCWGPRNIPGPLADVHMGSVKWTDLPNALIEARIFYGLPHDHLDCPISGIPDIVLSRTSRLRVLRRNQILRLELMIGRRKFVSRIAYSKLAAMFEPAPA